MSKDYERLKLPKLNEKSFDGLSSKDHLIELLKDETSMGVIDKSAFEWLTLEEAETLHQFLIKHQAATDFTPNEDDTTMKLNMLEWFGIHNLLIRGNLQFKLTHAEQDLLIKFMQRFDHLTTKNPVDEHVVQSFPVAESHHKEVYKKTEVWFKAVLVISALLIFSNLFLESKIINILTLITIVGASVGLIHKDKLNKTKMTPQLYSSIYAQVLVDNSY